MRASALAKSLGNVRAYRLGRFRCGGDSAVDLGVIVGVEPLMHNLAVELGQLEVSRVVFIVATVAKPSVVELLGVQVNELAELEVVGHWLPAR
jgi:hypothetical protein